MRMLFEVKVAIDDKGRRNITGPIVDICEDDNVIILSKGDTSLLRHALGYVMKRAVDRRPSIAPAVVGLGYNPPSSPREGYEMAEVWQRVDKWFAEPGDIVATNGHVLAAKINHEMQIGDLIVKHDKEMHHRIDRVFEAAAVSKEAVEALGLKVGDHFIMSDRATHSVNGQLVTPVTSSFMEEFWFVHYSDIAGVLK